MPSKRIDVLVPRCPASEWMQLLAESLPRAGASTPSKGMQGNARNCLLKACHVLVPRCPASEWMQLLAESLPCAGVSTPSKGMDAIACAHGQCIWGIESCTAIVVSDSQGSFPQRHQKFLCGEGHACVDCGVSQRSSADSGKSFACVLHLAFIVFPRTTARQMPGNCMASALQLNGNCIATAW